MFTEPLLCKKYSLGAKEYIKINQIKILPLKVYRLVGIKTYLLANEKNEEDY